MTKNKNKQDVLNATIDQLGGVTIERDHLIKEVLHMQKAYLLLQREFAALQIEKLDAKIQQEAIKAQKSNAVESLGPTPTCGATKDSHETGV